MWGGGGGGGSGGGGSVDSFELIIKSMIRPRKERQGDEYNKAICVGCNWMI